MSDQRDKAHFYPLFKGLSRKPTFMGVPTNMFFIAFGFVAVFSMFAGLIWWGLLLIVIPTLKIMTSGDDKAFDVLALELKTRATNGNKSFWNGSSYSPSSYDYRRPWVRRIGKNTQ